MLTSGRTASRVATSPRSVAARVPPALRGPPARPWVAARARRWPRDEDAPAKNPTPTPFPAPWESIVLSLTVIAGGLILRGAIEADIAEITAEMRATTAEIRADRAEFTAEIRAGQAKSDERWSALERELAGRREVLEYMVQQQQLAEENRG